MDFHPVSAPAEDPHHVPRLPVPLLSLLYSVLITVAQSPTSLVLPGPSKN
ncbi:MAG: hypothetical protein ACRBBQ_15345 [Cognatishimia sp.]